MKTMSLRMIRTNWTVSSFILSTWQRAETYEKKGLHEEFPRSDWPGDTSWKIILTTIWYKRIHPTVYSTNFRHLGMGYIRYLAKHEPANKPASTFSPCFLLYSFIYKVVPIKDNTAFNSKHSFIQVSALSACHDFPQWWRVIQKYMMKYLLSSPMVTLVIVFITTNRQETRTYNEIYACLPSQPWPSR